MNVRVLATPHTVDGACAGGAALNANPARLLRDLNWMGFLFESLVVRDLRVYAQALGGEVFHYRDDLGFEADAIIELPDGSWAAFEVKLGSSPPSPMSLHRDCFGCVIASRVVPPSRSASSRPRASASRPPQADKAVTDPRLGGPEWERQGRRDLRVGKTIEECKRDCLALGVAEFAQGCAYPVAACSQPGFLVDIHLGRL